jgi:hypothetical protein
MLSCLIQVATVLVQVNFSLIFFGFYEITMYVHVCKVPENLENAPFRDKIDASFTIQNISGSI